ncbi:MAG: hypothetical protein RSC19_03695 [Lachnospiraceae bacterium]
MELVTGFAGTHHITLQQIAEFQQAICNCLVIHLNCVIFSEIK